MQVEFGNMLTNILVKANRIQVDFPMLELRLASQDLKLRRLTLQCCAWSPCLSG
jgi:hypothetical protein